MAKLGPTTLNRRAIRLRDYDYGRAGAYFVTVCVQGRECLFGEVIDEKVRLNGYGESTAACWSEIPHHFPNVELDAFVVMPNHAHGILVIVNNDIRDNEDVAHPHNVRATHASPLQVPSNLPRGPKPGSIGAIVGSFKSAVTKRINEMRGTPGAAVWQRNYYEHAIRNDKSLNSLREYIANNSLKWELDQLHPDSPSKC